MITVEHVTKKFGDFTAVDDISFDVRPGELFALLGPNGAGKSTTIKMLTTLLQPTAGHLELNGHDVVRNQDAARKSFGIVFQDPSVDIELTALENMELHATFYGLPRRRAKERIAELLQLVELWERRDVMVKNYSGGMKRRLEIARGLLHHPKLLFLDEPTLGLDTQTRNLLWNYVQQLVHDENMTVLFTTQYLEEAAANAGRIAIIDHGKLLTIGTVKQLEKATGTKSLEAAYLKLTGSGTRDEAAGGTNAWRERARARSMR
jgi:ABC-2 type transport system ATP-binding protein